MAHGSPRLYRRAILLYLGTIVAPVCGLLWLGLQSFERQRQALDTLTAEKLEIELQARTKAAAELAFTDATHPVARDRFILQRGSVVTPALRAPLPGQAPPEFAEAERLELTLGRPDLALAAYRDLLDTPRLEALALSRIARCLSRLGRTAEARTTWHRLAQSHPDARDLSHRPFGIVGMIEAGETQGLYEQVSSGRWELSGDQAEYFLATIDPTRTSPYLERFRFAREVQEKFRPSDSPRPGDIQVYRLNDSTIFYRAESADRLIGFALNQAWINGTLRPGLERELGMTSRSRQDLWLYGGALALVLLVLSAGVLLLLRDISREARVNRLRSEFVSGVSHELKTPITLIRLYGETLLRHGSLSNQERDDFYRVITRESDRLGRLVNQVLSFSRVERGDQTYALEEGDPAPVLAGIVKDYGELLARAGFSVKCSLPTSAPAVRFDAAALSQAVVNLLDNAAKYSGESREIVVRLQAAAGQVTVEVEDHGVGIPPSEQSRIFERFYRAPNRTATGGYGLGLFMVRHIMEAHGGRAEVESEPGRGSRFRLVFPVVTEWAHTAS